MLAHAAVHIQSLFSFSHGHKHVRVVEFLFQYHQHDGQRTVCGSLPVCRCVCVRKLVSGILITENQFLFQFPTFYKCNECVSLFCVQV